jgi:hypothetical protein
VPLNYELNFDNLNYPTPSGSLIAVVHRYNETLEILTTYIFTKYFNYRYNQTLATSFSAWSSNRLVHTYFVAINVLGK